jgi:hypothetical protein
VQITLAKYCENTQCAGVTGEPIAQQPRHSPGIRRDKPDKPDNHCKTHDWEIFTNELQNAWVPCQVFRPSKFPRCLFSLFAFWGNETTVFGMNLDSSATVDPGSGDAPRVPARPFGLRFANSADLAVCFEPVNNASFMPTSTK